MKIVDKILIGKENSGRVDKFLAVKYEKLPRMFWKKAIENKNVKINGSEIEPKYKLKLGDKLEIKIEIEEEKIELQPEKKISLNILYQNNDFIVIDKPAGISVHPSRKEKTGTLANGLLYKFPKIKKVGEDRLRPGIVHRLDKETSGLMIIALNSKAFEFFKEVFKYRKIEKKYTALVWGKVKKEKGEIAGYIGKSKAEPTRQSFSQKSFKIDNPKDSLTFYEVIKRYEDKTLIELAPKTGRMHQIRVHLHSIGHPIVGDKKYFNKKIKAANKKYLRHMLHASFLRFEFWDGEECFYQSPLPKDFKIN